MKRAVLVFLAACASHPPSAPPPPPDLGNASPDGGAASTLLCTAGEMTQAELNLHDERRAVTGDEGTSTDHCDAAGDLVNFQCEQVGVPCPGGGGRGTFGFRRPARPCYQQTGRVLPEMVACDGRCRDGACPARCPQFGDTLTYVSVDAAGNAVFDSAADDRDIACAVVYDQSSDTYDCTHDPRVGDRLVIEGLGMSTTFCTGGTWGAVSDSRCTYGDCRYVR